jgi:MGT family glycosyltransferase
LAEVKSIHDRFNQFLASVNHPPYELGEFFEASPYMNLMLYPEQMQFTRSQPLNPEQFQYLEGCVRQEDPYEVPDFGEYNDKPLIYVSYGSLGAADVDLYKRMITLFANLPYRFLMNVGDYIEEYSDIPTNIHLSQWFPQPSVLPHIDLFIHHGGNNSFNEALYFGKPAIIMPFCWDGHDNAQRIQDTGYGLKLPRYAWQDEDLVQALDSLLNDSQKAEKLQAISQHMQQADGRQKAANIILEVIEKHGN